MMDAFLGEYVDRLRVLHEVIERCIGELPAVALDWTPGVEMNSIAVLVTHLTGAERYWVGDVALQEPSARVRAEEFEVVGGDAAVLYGRLQNSLAYVQQAVARLSLDDLAAERPSPNHTRPFTVAWALLHALEHTAVHTGHIELTAQLWRQQ